MENEGINELVEQYHKALPKQIREYLNQRGLHDEIINRFKIGWTNAAIAIRDVL